MVKQRFPLLELTIMESLQPHLTALLISLPHSLDDRQKLNELVALTLLKTRDIFSQENRKAAWEYLLKNDIFQLAVHKC